MSLSLDHPHIKHRKVEMTLIYARIANRVVADEYAAVSAKIDALYGQAPQLPADYETTSMARLRREAHSRMLGNGLCTRPPELDCRMSSRLRDGWELPGLMHLNSGVFSL